MVSLLLIVKNKEFLLFKRSMDAIHPGLFGLCGGTVEKGETPVEAIIREIKEEIGMDIFNSNLIKRYNRNGNIINLFAVVNNGFEEQDIRLNKEHTEWKYFTYYELLNSKETIPTTIEFVNDFFRSYK